MNLTQAPLAYKVCIPTLLLDSKYSVAQPMLSPVAMLTERIRAVGRHMEFHPRDAHVKRAMAILVSRRRKLLKYMMRTDYNNYR